MTDAPRARSAGLCRATPLRAALRRTRTMGGSGRHSRPRCCARPGPAPRPARWCTPDTPDTRQDTRGIPDTRAMWDTRLVRRVCRRGPALSRGIRFTLEVSRPRADTQDTLVSTLDTQDTPGTLAPRLDRSTT